MLWDMARFQNYDIRSPYNREAAQWSANQTTFRFPTDARPLRDVPGRPRAGRVAASRARARARGRAKMPEPASRSCILDMEIDFHRDPAPAPAGAPGRGDLPRLSSEGLGDASRSGPPMRPMTRPVSRPPIGLAPSDHPAPNRRSGGPWRLADSTSRSRDPSCLKYGRRGPRTARSRHRDADRTATLPRRRARVLDESPVRDLCGDISCSRSGVPKVRRPDRIGSRFEKNGHVGDLARGERRVRRRHRPREMTGIGPGRDDAETQQRRADRSRRLPDRASHRRSRRAVQARSRGRIGPEGTTIRELDRSGRGEARESCDPSAGRIRCRSRSPRDVQAIRRSALCAADAAVALSRNRPPTAWRWQRIRVTGHHAAAKAIRPGTAAAIGRPLQPAHRPLIDDPARQS